MRMLSTIVLIVFISTIYGQSGLLIRPPISYNQPKFCSNVSWNPYGTTIAEGVVSNYLYNIFIDINNNIYITAQTAYASKFWLTQSLNRTIKNSLWPGSKGIFVTENGSIYISNTDNNQIEKRIWNSGSVVTVLNVSNACSGLFIDINNTLYCSIESEHKIISASLTNVSKRWNLTAGNGSSGFGLNQLSFPNGIFVSINFSLYVADCGNDRIQLFTIGNLTGRTLIGNDTSAAIKLLGPTGIVLDADNNLYIADSYNHRIVVFGPNGLRCLVGCLTGRGNSTYQLDHPDSLGFDSYGNLFVVDLENYRVQMFMLSTNSCSQTTASIQMPTITKQVQSSTNKDRTTVISTTAVATSTALTTHKGGIFTTIQRREQSTNAPFVSLQSTMMSISKNVNTTTLQTTSVMSTTDMTTSKSSFHSLMMRTSEIYDTTIRSARTATTASITNVSIQNVFTTIHDTTSATMNIIINNTISPSIYFVPKNCSDSLRIGTTCNTSSVLCDMANPCQNLGTCFHNTTIPYGYVCKCSPKFNGMNCEHDIRLCKSTTCWNNGTCSTPSNDNFLCSCLPGWEGNHCEQMINYCQNITCLNHGFCRPLLLDYKCECLSEIYSGQYCERVAKFILVRQYISRSVASIAIVMMCSAITFIIVLDVMKYVFHFDVSREELQRVRRKRWAQKRKVQIPQKPSLAIRYIYVNKPPIIHEQVIENTS